jgi:hypothetical protein
LVRAFALTALLTPACATVTEHSTVRDEPAYVKHEVTEVAGSRGYVVAAQAVGTDLVLDLSETQQCERRDTPIVKRKRHITREASGFTPTHSFILGTVGMLAGIGFAASSSPPPDMPIPGMATMSPPDDTARLAGAAIALTVGVMGLAIGSYDLRRVRDTEEDEGTVEGKPEVTRENCNSHPVALTALRLVFGDDFVLTGATDRKGRAVLSMKLVPAEQLPSVDHTAQLRFLGHETHVGLADAPREQLERALAADGTSRVAQAHFAVDHSQCDDTRRQLHNQVLAASASDLDAVARLAQLTQAAVHACSPAPDQVVAIKAELEPSGPRFRGLYARAEGDLNAALGGFRHGVTAATMAALEDRVARAKTLGAPCEGLAAGIAELAPQCQHLGALVAAAGKEIAAHEGEVAEARKQAQVQDRARKAARLRAEWRAHMGECRRVRAALEKLAQIEARGKCSPECAKAGERIRAEQARLRQFQTEMIDDADARRDVKKECEQSGCEVCPHE